MCAGVSVGFSCSGSFRVWEVIHDIAGVSLQILFGFAMPLGYVYMHQVAARRRYAKRSQLREANVPFFHARSSKLIFLDVVLIVGSVVGQLVEQPLQLLG